MVGHSKRIIFVLTFIVLLLSGPLVTPVPAALQDGDEPVVVINEVQASNTQTLADPQGQFDDWIELYNPAATPINVGGMYLTDDPDDPTKWQIPVGNAAVTTLAPGGYLLIWADNDVTDQGLHANFKLSADGDEVALFDVDGQSLIDHISFGSQSADMSFGYYPDGQGDPNPMMTPSPGAANVMSYKGVVADLKFSRTRGMYDGPFELAITCETPGVDIYYTRDGTDPLDESGRIPTGARYTGPFFIFSTDCIRARAGKIDWKPSPIATHTYLFVDDICDQSPNGERPGPEWPSGSVNGQVIDYGMDPDVVNDPRYADVIDDALLSIPSISLVTDVDNLFDRQTGIYVNARAQGTNWERPVSVELIDPNGSEGFQVNAGIRIRGGYSRSSSNPKHAFRLFFRAQYGQAKLKFPLFGNEGVDEFDGVDLRTSQNYSWSFEGGNRDTFVREVFSRDTQRHMDKPYTRSRYYHLYINGQYWGLFQTQERSEASYAESYFGGDKEDYDVIKSRAGNGGYDIEATDGTLDAWRRLWDVATAGFDNDVDYYRVQGLNPDGTVNPNHEKLLDVENLIDYMLCTYYVGDPDGPVSAWARVANNFYGIYNRENPDGFKFFRHDGEHSLYDLYESRLFAPTTEAVGDRFNQSNPLWMHLQLMAHSEYRMRFADRIYKHFFNDGVLAPGPCIERFMTRAQQIDMAIIAESARWGDSKRSRPRTKDDDWVPDINGMVNNYFPSRTNVVVNQFRSEGWYPSVSPPQVYVNGQVQRGGLVDPADAISMTGGGNIWYTLDGSDPRAPGTMGVESDAVVLVPEEAPKRVLVPTGPVDEAWRGGAAFDDSSWLSGSGGVGYETTTGYEDFFDIDVLGQMYFSNASCYIRIPFELSDAEYAAATSLALGVRYDDGFVAYLNGVEVQRALFDGTPAWNSSASGSHSDIDAIELVTFNISNSVSALRPGQNILAIHGLNTSSTSSDFLISVELTATEGPAGGAPGGPSATAIAYVDPLMFAQSTQVKARVLNGATWSALEDLVFSVGPVAESLRISEMMYHPADLGDPDDPNTEYIELTNIGAEAINLNLVRFTNGVDFTFGNVELAPGGYVLVVRDIDAFNARYGQGLLVAGAYVGSLNNAGERIELQDAAGRMIHDFRFRDGWYDLTDGQGFSLTVKDPAAGSDLETKNAWRPSGEAGGSPGFDDSGLVPELGAVVINEVMANPAAGQSDWIELHNTTNQDISLGGWFLSDDGDNLTQYEIPQDAAIAAGSYTVLTRDAHLPFGLNRNGETVYLHSGSGGTLTGYTEQERFDASEAGVSLGRHQKSTGAYNFVALSEPTPGGANAQPKVGPIVINEIMYNPVGLADGEYVELLNVSDAPVTLYDAAQGAPWRFTDDPDNPKIDFFFPIDDPIVLAPGETLLLVTNAMMFGVSYTVPAGVRIVDLRADRLPDTGGKIQLSRPGDEDPDGMRHWIRVDRVVYSDGAHPERFPAGIDPWPVAAAGNGASLQRIDTQAYGNDPANWQPAPPSPGLAN